MKSLIKSYGGSQEESCSCMIKTMDGGYILTGSFTSNDGDFKGLKKGEGLYDIYVLKLSQTGDMEWIKTYGGDSYDFGISIIETKDGSLVLLGTTQSSKGDHNPFYSHNGSVKRFIMKLSISGDLIWCKVDVGDKLGDLESIIEDSNGDLVVTGASRSNNSENGTDIFIAKLTSSGDFIWIKTYGGSNYDRARAIVNTDDGGYALTGFSQSNDGDFKESRINNNSPSLFLIKLDNSGRIEWLNRYGGNAFDQGNSLIQTDDGGFVIVGETESNDGDFERFREGIYDSFILKVSKKGEIEWKKFYGGIGETRASSVILACDDSLFWQLPERKLILFVGNTNSISGDFEGLKESTGKSVFIIKLNKLGGSAWKKIVNGYDAYCSSIIEYPNGIYALAGHARNFIGIDGFRKGEKSIFFMKIDSTGNLIDL